MLKTPFSVTAGVKPNTASVIFLLGCSKHARLVDSIKEAQVYDRLAGTFDVALYRLPR